MKRVLFLVVAIFAVALTSASAQKIANVRSSIGHTAANGGVVTITEDEGVKTAISKVEAKTSTPSKAPGYRFVIYYDNEQYADERAAKELRKFRAKFKEVTSYISSESPSFRVVVGDCFNYEDVAIVRNHIIEDYPDAALSDASIPYRVLCRIKGTNRMRIERNGYVMGGIELDDITYDELDLEGNVVTATETPAEEATVEEAPAIEASEEKPAEAPAAEVVAEETSAEEVPAVEAAK
jgi:hypothetical protein